MRRMWLVALVGCASHARVEAQRTDVRVTIEAPGQTATQLDAKVATPLGVELASAHPRTISRDGVVTLDLTGTDGSTVARAIAEVDLPQGMRPTIATYTGQHVVRRYVARSADSLVATAALHEQWRTAIMRVPGVSRVEVCGAQPAVRVVRVDTQRALAFGVTVRQIRDAIEGARPTADALPDVAIPAPAGTSAVRLRDLATIDVEARRDGCLARDHVAEVIVGEVWANKSSITLPPAPPGLEIRELGSITALDVDRIGATREAELVAVRRAVDRATEHAGIDAIVEDGDELRVLVPTPTVADVLAGLRQSPGIVAHAPPPLVVTVFDADRPQLIESANAIAFTLGAHADGIIGLADHDVSYREPDRPAVARANLEIEDVNDALAAASDTGLELDLAEPTMLRVSALDAMTTALTRLDVGREPIELRRCGGMPCLKIRVTGNPDEITRLVRRMKLPPAVFWQLER